MNSCIFCKIVAGEIPSHIVHEDDATVAFLDIGPVARGHVLVVPRVHAQTLDQLPEGAARAVGAALVRVGGAVVRATGAAAWNVLQNNGERAGQLVPHVHFHVIPRYDGDGFDYTWRTTKLEAEDAAELRAKITGALGQTGGG